MVAVIIGREFAVTGRFGKITKYIRGGRGGAEIAEGVRSFEAAAAAAPQDGTHRSTSRDEC
jgi:hypothetical protein